MTYRPPCSINGESQFVKDMAVKKKCVILEILELGKERSPNKLIWLKIENGDLDGRP
jgi:hypothetical protein